LRDFERWLSDSARRPAVFAHPSITARALGEDLGLPDLSDSAIRNPQSAIESDGLEWFLRLAVLWQQTAAPLRRTQQGGFFKRDLERLRGDPLLTATDAPVPPPDLGLLAADLALREGLLGERDGELRAGAFPPSWEESAPAATASLWAALCDLKTWNVQNGWRPGTAPANPYPAVYLLALLLLARLPEGGWADPAALDRWLAGRHPYWREAGGAGRACGAAAFLLGLAHPLRLVQAARVGKGWLVRLSPLGRWLLGLGEAPSPGGFPQTLLVQPNLEILAYRQGLTPALVGQLARFATWKGLGAACTLQLEPPSVYRALESGETFETIRAALERHGMKATPGPVLDALRTWADKRERIQVFAAAALFEFDSAADLDRALARGLPALRLSDRLAVVAREADIDYRHFRLTATRDCSLPPERCLDVEDDGVTLTVDLARSDLLVETELQRFAEPVERGGAGRRAYRLTPASLAAARQGGLTLHALEAWFAQRCVKPLPPAARLLLVGPQTSPFAMRPLLVLQVPTAEAADGLLQWPQTRVLIEARLGPAALAVAEENAAALRQRLAELGIDLGP
jgi:hypothetical protein